jgi:hypothetical protein
MAVQAGNRLLEVIWNSVDDTQPVANTESSAARAEGRRALRDKYR